MRFVVIQTAIRYECGYSTTTIPPQSKKKKFHSDQALDLAELSYIARGYSPDVRSKRDTNR